MIQFAIKVVVFILMILVGTDCTKEGLRNCLIRPGLTITVGLGQFFIVPAIMYVSCYTLGASPEVIAGLMLIACCPAGTISNTYCYLLKGNTSLSVSLTVASNFAAIVLTPIALIGVYGLIDGQSGGIQIIPTHLVVRELVLRMLLPILIGAGIRAQWPQWISAQHQYLRKIAMILTIALLALIIGSGMEEIFRHLTEIALITILCTALLLFTGWLISRLFHLCVADRLAVLLELPCRNLAFAAITGITILNRPELVRFSAALFIVQALMILILFMAINKRREIRGVSSN